MGSGLFKPACHVKNRTEFFVRLDVIRIDGKRAFVVDNRFFGTIVRRKKTRKVVVSFGQAGSNDEGPLVVIDRFLSSLRRAQRVGKVMMDRGVVRSDGERFLVTGDRLLRNGGSRANSREPHGRPPIGGRRQPHVGAG